MDITLIPQAESKYSKKYHQSFLTDNGLAQLSDCSLILLHKSGMRPLYLISNKKERILTQPEHKVMAKPDLIIYTGGSEAAKQSAQVIQEQVKNCDCEPEMLEINLPPTEKINDFKIQKNIFSTRCSDLERKGYHHIVMISDFETLDMIARCMNDKGLKQNHNIPIYSFSDGKEIEDVNLVNNFYVTRDLLDNWLVTAVNRNIIPFKGKCCYPLSLYQVQKKLHIPE